MPADNSLLKNRKALHDYAVLETFEAGIELQGTEVKSCRAGQIQCADAYAEVKEGQCWLLNVHIAEYAQGNRNNHEPTRPRRLLLHKLEIRKMQAAVGEKGLTLVPLGFYLKQGKVKVTIGICRGKSKVDKRDTLKKKEADRSMQQALKLRHR